ncbi:MAG TPA: site-2 protease family protein [Candidatus Limnocylindrales bacterium]|nr:site-2 protease family protein [Candidatus Limnocylindrales bacterium]
MLGRPFIAEEPVLAIMLIAFCLLIAFPVHEFFHAYAADRLGDRTPRGYGRLTLNPIAHFHPVGGTMLVISVALAGIPLGFAATPVNPSNLRGRYGEAIVAVAGPLSNLVLAAAAAIPLRFVYASGLDFEYPILEQALALIVWGNIILGLFNLVPVPPLDGGAILLSVVSRETAWQLRPILSQYGLLILVALFFLPIFNGQTIGGRVLIPIADAVFRVLVG